MPEPVSVSDLHRPEQHFKCEPYHAVMRAKTCVKRQAKARALGPEGLIRFEKATGRYPPDMYQCLACPLGQAVRAALGEEVASIEEAPAPSAAPTRVIPLAGNRPGRPKKKVALPVVTAAPPPTDVLTIEPVHLPPPPTPAERLVEFYGVQTLTSLAEACERNGPAERARALVDRLPNRIRDALRSYMEQGL